MDKSILLVLACRYLYYCKSISYYEDSVYDALEKYAKTFPNSEILNNVSSDKSEDYSPEVIDFANKLLNET